MGTTSNILELDELGHLGVDFGQGPQAGVVRLRERRHAARYCDTQHRAQSREKFRCRDTEASRATAKLLEKGVLKFGEGLQ